MTASITITLYQQYTHILGSLLITSIAAESEVSSLCNMGAADPFGARFERKYVIYGAAKVWDRKYKNWSPGNSCTKLCYGADGVRNFN